MVCAHSYLFVTVNPTWFYVINNKKSLKKCCTNVVLLKDIIYLLLLLTEPTDKNKLFLNLLLRWMKYHPNFPFRCWGLVISSSCFWMFSFIVLGAAKASALINKWSDEQFGKQLVFFIFVQKSNIEKCSDSSVLSHSTPLALKFTQNKYNSLVWQNGEFDVFF